MKGRFLRALVALALLVVSPGFAQSWKVEQEESVSLQYRDAKDEASLIEVSCSGTDSSVVVPVPPGIRDHKPLRLDVVAAGKVETLELPASICGRGGGECVDRPNGEVSDYLLRRSGRDLALRLARATSFSTTGAATLSAAATSSVFAEFAELCRKQRRNPTG